MTFQNIVFHVAVVELFLIFFMPITSIVEKGFQDSGLIKHVYMISSLFTDDDEHFCCEQSIFLYSCSKHTMDVVHSAWHSFMPFPPLTILIIFWISIVPSTFPIHFKLSNKKKILNQILQIKVDNPPASSIIVLPHLGPLFFFW